MYALNSARINKIESIEKYRAQYYAFEAIAIHDGASDARTVELAATRNWRSIFKCICLSLRLNFNEMLRERFV